MSVDPGDEWMFITSGGDSDIVSSDPSALLSPVIYRNCGLSYGSQACVASASEHLFIFVRNDISGRHECHIFTSDNALSAKATEFASPGRQQCKLVKGASFHDVTDTLETLSEFDPYNVASSEVDMSGFPTPNRKTKRTRYFVLVARTPKGTMISSPITISRDSKHIRGKSPLQKMPLVFAQKPKPVAFLSPDGPPDAPVFAPAWASNGPPAFYGGGTDGVIFDMLGLFEEATIIPKFQSMERDLPSLRVTRPPTEWYRVEPAGELPWLSWRIRYSAAGLTISPGSEMPEGPPGPIRVRTPQDSESEYLLHLWAQYEGDVRAEYFIWFSTRRARGGAEPNGDANNDSNQFLNENVFSSRSSSTTSEEDCPDTEDNRDTTVGLRAKFIPVDEYPILVRTLSGKCVTVNVSKATTVEDVKKTIHAREGIPVNQQRLTFGNQELHDSTVLVDVGINTGAIITLLMKIVGGVWLSPEDNGKIFPLGSDFVTEYYSYTRDRAAPRFTISRESCALKGLGTMLATAALLQDIAEMREALTSSTTTVGCGTSQELSSDSSSVIVADCEDVTPPLAVPSVRNRSDVARCGRLLPRREMLRETDDDQQHACFGRKCRWRCKLVGTAHRIAKWHNKQARDARNVLVGPT